MDTSNLIEKRLRIILEADRAFQTYQFELTPAETLAFAQQSPPPANCSSDSLVRLIQRINELVSTVKIKTRLSSSSHVFHVGRKHRARMISIDFFRGYFPRGFQYAPLYQTIEAFALEAKCSDVFWEEDVRHSFVIHILWD